MGRIIGNVSMTVDGLTDVGASSQFRLLLLAEKRAVREAPTRSLV